MISFEHPYFIIFLLLAAIPLLVYIIYKAWVKKNLSKIGNERNVSQLLTGFSLNRNQIKLTLLISSIVIMVFALMNFRKGSGTEVTDRKGLDVIIALDVSKSMLARDIEPNRLIKAKAFIDQTLQSIKNDRVGLVIFAGSAYLQSPVTSDFSAVKMMLETTGPDAVPSQGTVVGEAIDLARKSFNRETNKYKALILISDGEDHDETAIAMAKLAHDEGVNIFTIGVGSPEGAEIIDPVTGQAKTDENGQKVISKLNDQMLKEIAVAAKGDYQQLVNTSKTAETIVAGINKLEKRNEGSVVFTQYKSYYQIFLLIALALLFTEGLLANIKRKKNVSLQ